MIEEKIVGIEGFDQITQTFIPAPKTRTIRLEHSLISISKWEEQTKRRFLSKFTGPKTKEDWITYMQCMSLDGPIDPMLLQCMTQEQFNKVVQYIGDKKTAHTFSSDMKGKNKNSNEELSSELIYFYMAEYRLPWYAEKWHLSRLLTLIEIANRLHSGDKSKMNKRDILNRYAAINEANKRKFHSKG